MSYVDELNQIINERDAIYEKIALLSGLPSLSYRILYIMRVNKNKSFLQSEIADEYSFSRKSINSAVLVLKNKNYITLILEKGKGNRKFLSFTNDGEEFAKKWLDPYIQADDNSFYKLSKNEQENLIFLEKKLLNLFKDELKNIGFEVKRNDKK